MNNLIENKEKIMAYIEGHLENDFNPMAVLTGVGVGGLFPVGEHYKESVFDKPKEYYSTLLESLYVLSKITDLSQVEFMHQPVWEGDNGVEKVDSLDFLNYEELINTINNYISEGKKIKFYMVTERSMNSNIRSRFYIENIQNHDR